MGSFCVVYFFKDFSDTRLYTRNGHRLDFLGEEVMESIFAILKPIHEKLGVETEAILEGELLPWSLLGQGLIDEEYKPMMEVHDYYIDWRGQPNAESIRKFREEELMLSREELDKRYKHHEIKYYRGMLLLDPGDTGLYVQQVERYGYKGEPEFKPFHLTLLNGKYPSIYEMNDLLGTTCITMEDALNSDSDREGVVVKPVQNWVNLPSGIPSAIKCRYEAYLHLIYGPTFNPGRLRLTRSLGKKRATHLRELDICQKLMKVETEVEYLYMMNALLELEDYEKELDKYL